jgi:hypothetical protein
MAAVADFVPVERRGRAYGSLTAANMGGAIAGPLIGASLFQVSLAATFLASAFTALVVTGVIAISLPRLRPAVLSSNAERPTLSLWRDPIIVGVTIASTAVGILIGMYDTVWSLLMHARHATDLEIGLSFTLFALPFTLGSWPAGWLADHMDNRWLIGISSLAAGCLFRNHLPLPSQSGLVDRIGDLRGDLYSHRHASETCDALAAGAPQSDGTGPGPVRVGSGRRRSNRVVSRGRLVWCLHRPTIHSHSSCDVAGLRDPGAALARRGRTPADRPTHHRCSRSDGCALTEKERARAPADPGSASANARFSWWVG